MVDRKLDMIDGRVERATAWDPCPGRKSATRGRAWGLGFPRDRARAFLVTTPGSGSVHVSLRNPETPNAGARVWKCAVRSTGGMTVAQAWPVGCTEGNTV